jgi:menaquinone-dependent protoporphyrinogen oxidase
MPPSFTVYVASQDGHAVRVAGRILARLGRDPADMQRLGPQPPALDPTRPALLVAAVRYGDHLPAARTFLKEFAAMPERPPLALASINLTARKPNKQTAEESAYLKKAIKALGFAPAAARAFAGKIDYPRYAWGDRQIIRFIMWLTKGPTNGTEVIEYTDWDDVDAFADTLPAAFGAQV